MSPRGIEKHRRRCNQDNCGCKPRIRICRNKCFKALERKAIPKFSIANGNWFGQLPPDLHNMTFGTKSLIRPVHVAGRLVAYSTKSYVGGTRMTGHIYSTKLDTPFVRKSIPLQPSEVPVRVLVVSPFSDDKSAHNQGKLASAKKEYIINPEQIKNTIAFWNAVGNKTMQKIHFNEEVFASLPVNDVSADMFTVTNETEEKENNEDSDTSSESGMETNNEDQDNCLGGPSLLRTNHESDEVVMTSATVTIGGTRHHDTNTHEKVMQVLSENENIETKEKTFVVRPPKEFVSDLDPDFLEIHYPDLLPFGRGGFGEPRRTNIS